MWAFAETIRGMADACRALGTPVTGGNVSLLQRVGRLGDLADAGRRHARAARATTGCGCASAFPEAGPGRVPAGRDARRAGRDASSPRWCWARLAGGRRRSTSRPSAAAPAADEAAARDLLASAHDCSDGGLAVPLAESAIAGGVGVRGRRPRRRACPTTSRCSPSRRREPWSRSGPGRESRARATGRGREACRSSASGSRAAPRSTSTGCSRSPCARRWWFTRGDPVADVRAALLRVARFGDVAEPIGLSEHELAERSGADPVRLAALAGVGICSRSRTVRTGAATSSA